MFGEPLRRTGFSLVLALSGLSPLTATAALPDLSGVWTLNASLSDNPQDAIESVAETGGKKRGIFGRIAGNVGVSVGGIPVGNLPLPSGKTPKEEQEEPVTADRNIVAPVSVLQIVQDNNSVEVQYGNNKIWMYQNGEVVHRDGKKVLAKWKRKSYLVEILTESGTEETERFEIDRAGRLHWTLTVDPKKGKRQTYTRVYDPVIDAGQEFAQNTDL